MNRRQPVGTVGGGGWQSNASPQKSHVSKVKEEEESRVLSQMFEMFIDVIDAEVIQSVVHSYHYNSSKAMEALISISSDDAPVVPSKCISWDEHSQNNNVSGLYAIGVAYGDTEYESDNVEDESEAEMVGNVTTSMGTSKSAMIPVLNSLGSEVQRSPAALKSFVAQPAVIPVPASTRSNCTSAKSTCKYNYQISMERIEEHIKCGLKILILMRGCPGSGKSFLAQKIIGSIGGVPNQHIFSTDNFFIRGGKYNFQASQLSDAHKWNQELALTAVKSGISPIIIDNTNTQRWEMEIYVNMALHFGYTIEILEPQTHWFSNARGLFRRNSHSIPLDKIEQMLSRYENDITANTLIQKALSRGLITAPNIPQPATKPVGIKMNSAFEGAKALPSAPFGKTGAIKKVQTNRIPPNPISRDFSDSLFETSQKTAQSCYNLLTSNLSKSSQKDDSVDTLYHDYQLMAEVSPVTKPINTSLKKPENSTDMLIQNRSPISINDNSLKLSACAVTTDNNCALADLQSFGSNLKDVKENYSGGLEVCNNNDTFTYFVNNLQEEPTITSNHRTSSTEMPSVSLNTDVYISSEDEEIPDNVTMLSDSIVSLNNNQCSASDAKNLTTSLGNLVLSSSPAHNVPERTNQNDYSSKLAFFKKCSESVKTKVKEEDVEKRTHSSDNNDAQDVGGSSEEHESVPNSTEKSLSENFLEFDFINFAATTVSNLLSSCDSAESSESSCPTKTSRMEDSTLLRGNSRSSCHFQGEGSQSNSLLQSSNELLVWDGQGSWDNEKPGKIPVPGDIVDAIPQPKPPRSPKEVRETPSLTTPACEIPHSSKLEESWTFCDSNSVSWKTIDKNQEEFYGLTKSSLEGFSCSQREKFYSKDKEKCESSTKETMTHHSDFLLVNAPVPIILESGLKFLIPNDRDINFGRPNLERKICLKLMLDKSTTTESEFPVSEEGETDAKLTELSRLFPNISKAGLIELLDKCKGDVNWVSNLLLDTENDVFSSSFFQEASEETEPEDAQDTTLSVSAKIESKPTESQPVQKDLHSQSEEFLEQAKEIKKHLEKSIIMSEDSYSPHVLSIRNFRQGLREGALPKSEHPSPSTSYAQTIEPSVAHEDLVAKQDSHEESRAKSEEGSEEDDDDGDLLELIVGQDFIQQLLDKFGGSEVCNTKRLSPVVRIPVSVARHLHYYLLTSQENQEDAEDNALRLQCEEDERLAHQLFEDMQANRHAEPSSPQLQEIMDFQMAEAIYQADLNALSRSSEETMATILAKRLLQDSFPNIDAKVLHDMLHAHGNSFEETVKVLRQSLTDSNTVFSANGCEQREKDLLYKAKKASLSANGQKATRISRSADSEEYDSRDALADASVYRETAELLREQRKECYLKARDAFQRKERSVAAYYAQLANCHMKNIDQANARAAASIVAASDHSRTPDTLDLHYLRVAEALQVLDLFLDRHISNVSDSGSGKVNLYIITGRGARSVDGKSRIRPAVIRRIRDRNLEFTVENPGLLKVSVSRYSHLSYSPAS